MVKVFDAPSEANRSARARTARVDLAHHARNVSSVGEPRGQSRYTMQAPWNPCALVEFVVMNDRPTNGVVTEEDDTIEVRIRASQPRRPASPRAKQIKSVSE